MSSLAPANPRASEGARKLLSRIAAVPGGSILSGQHNTPRELSAWSGYLAGATNRHPTVWGQDFGFAAAGDMDGIENRQAIVDEAIAQHRSGAIVTLMWHAVPPTEVEPVTFEGSIAAGPLSDADWRALLTPGSEVHQNWTDQVDVVAGYLTQLRDANVPVLWRPYHEMNGNWFWWGGRPGPDGYQQLYRQLFGRLSEHHNLDNLIWVWNANAPRGDAAPYSEFYPGGDVVDALAADVYAGDYKQSHHDELLDLAEGRPIGLGEVGEVFDPVLLDEQPAWAWFMIWAAFVRENNVLARVKRLLQDERTISLR